MDDPNNNEEFDASQAMQKARKQAQAQARAHAKDGNKKENSTKKNGGAILHVNNYRNGVPEAKCKMSKNPNFPTSLKPGYVVRSKGAVESSFIVEAKLAARVYMVRNQKTEKFCALKIEPYYNEGDVKQLKRDVFILMEAMKLDQRFNVHFPKIISKGRVPDHFKYVITALCDFNLDDLREKVIKNDFSLQTAARLSMQAFQALHDMHTLGYLHRNIAPSKFMLGLENSTLIYLGGFSTAYRFKRKDGKESPSPKKLYKMSKIRFLPRAYHRFKEFSLFDDVESWLYTSIDFFGRKLLPWFDNMDESQIVANKERFFFDAFEEVFTYAPKQLQVIQKYIDKNNDGDKPNYTFMGITLVGMRDKLKFPYSGPFDFQLANVSGPRRKKSKNRRLTKEEKVTSDGGEAGGSVIAPASFKKKKSSKAATVEYQGDAEVFEEGEIEQPQQETDGKPSLNADRALSLARKKKPSKTGTTAKAAHPDMDSVDQSPLKPLDPGVVKALKKKKSPALPPPTPLEEEEEDENGSDKLTAPPPPPVVIKAKRPKSSKPKSSKKKPAAPTSKLEAPSPAEKEAADGGGEEDEGGDDENDDGNETGTDNSKPDL